MDPKMDKYGPEMVKNYVKYQNTTSKLRKTDSKMKWKYTENEQKWTENGPNF